MKKSLIALLLVVALVVTVSVFTVSAEVQTSSDLTVNGTTATGYCPHCQKDVTWTEYVPSTTTHNDLKTAGHFFLSTSYTSAGALRLAAKVDVVLHLNGNTYTRNGTTASVMLNAVGTFSIVDSTAGTGALKNSSSGPVLIAPATIVGPTFNLYSGSMIPTSNQAIQMNDTCNINIHGGSVTGTTATTGGAVAITKGTLNLYGGTVSGSAKEGGAVYATGTSSKLVVDGGTITGSTATDRGGSISLRGGASLEVNSGSIENGCAWGNQMGGNVYAEGNVTVSGGTITGGNTTGTANTPSVKGATSTIRGAGRGGNICIRGAYTLTMTGGTISDGVSPSGGNLSIEGSKTDHSFSGGTISGGEALNGGNIYIAANAPGGTFSGTTVENGIVYVTSSSNGRGGNLYNTTGTFNITGGSFTGGAIKGTKTAANTGFGANIMTQKNMTITNATISGGNAENSFGGNLAVHGGASVTLGQGGIITNGTALRATGNSANGQGGNVYILKGTFTVAGGTVSNTTGAANAQHAGNIYIPTADGTLAMTSGTISGGQALSYGGNIYAYTNSTVNVTGGTISGGKAAQGGNVYVRATNKVTLKDCNITGGTGYSIYLMDAAAGATLNGATVSGATAGAIRNVGTLTLTNATISGNTGATAPGVYNLAGATVTMTGGSISGNTATTSSYSSVARGGNVYNSGTFNLVSGTIENGIVQNSYKRATGEAQVVLAMGGNIYNDGTFTMTTGTISGGQARRSGTGDNLCQGGNIYNAGTFTMADGTITGGNAVSNGGNVMILGTAEKAATFTMENGTISEGFSAGSQGGVFASAYATFTMNDGLIDGNDSTWTGANVGAGGTNSVLDINGGTISNGESEKGAGGNLFIQNGATVTVDDATISGGITKTAGGNIQYEGGSATFTNCTISGGNASTTGGNINVALASGATFDKCDFVNCEITGGHSTGIGGNINITVAGSSFTGCEITDGVAGTKVTEGEGEDETLVAPTTDGRGGNVATNANTTFTNCVFRNGESYGTANPGGGNIYIYGGTNQILDGCTITGGFAYKTGGNIVLHGTPTVYIKGDSYIAGGESYTGWGGNIGYTNAAKLYLQGNTEVDGAEAYCLSGAHYGNNIGMSNANANVSHELHVEDNAVIKNGDHKDRGETMTRYSVAVAPATSTATPKIYLSGNGSIDKIFLRGNTAVGVDNIVVLKAGYTGSAQVYTSFATYNNSVVPGANVYAAVTMDGYTGTGSLKVLNQGQTGFITFVDNGVLKVAGITGFKGYNVGTDDAYTVETGFATLDAVVDAGYDYAKLYAGGTYTLSAKTDNFPIDLNNQVVTINTGSYKLAPIDYRTDGNVTAKYTQLTVDNDANVVLKTQNPINKYQYLNVKVTDAETGDEYWTSNRVTVQLTKVSIKTTKDGIYYTTKIGTNANAAPKLVDYGTAVSLVPGEIGADFLDHLDTNGVMYTAFDLNKTDDFSITARSALVSGILSEGATNPDNDTRAKYDITANSFVTAIVDDEEVKIMADESHVLSFEDIMIKLDDKVEELNRLQPEGYAKTIETAVAFYEKWADPFAAWDCLPNLKALAAA